MKGKNHKTLIFIIAFTLLVGLIISYSNHFNNGFYFDDHHTITDNVFIRDLKNIPSFYTSIETFGTMPNNRAYRPVVTTLNAIDYYLGNGLNPFSFHLSIFISYILLGLLLFFLIRRIIFADKIDFKKNLIALMGTSLFMFHTANAETINYIIMRSDSFSTLCVVAALVMYAKPFCKKRLLYTVPVFIGIATKESALMFLPIFMLYKLMFEQNFSALEILSKNGFVKVITVVKETLVFSIVLVAFFMFTRLYFTAQSAANTPDPHNAFYYFVTQWHVISTYVGNFILPLDLSVDKDFSIVSTVFNQKAIFGLLLILTMIAVAVKCSYSEKWRPVSFGILWFFIALAPTSSFKPFGQIANDHRTFFAFIGLVIALTATIKNWLEARNYFNKSPVRIALLSSIFFFFVAMHGYGTYQRNKVWNNNESLWSDAAVKAPGNGRVLMNYGLALMAKGDYQNALTYLERAYKILPYWAYTNINLGILKSALGDNNTAEWYYKNDISVQPDIVESYYYYALFLDKMGRYNEALQMLEKTVQLSPGHIAAKDLYPKLKLKGTSDKEKKFKMLDDILSSSSDPNQLLEASLQFYHIQEFGKCIAACEKALTVKPNFPEAYNNICSAYNALKLWDKAIVACEKAIAIKPDYTLAANNLSWAKTNLTAVQK